MPCLNNFSTCYSHLFEAVGQKNTHKVKTSYCERFDRFCKVSAFFKKTRSRVKHLCFVRF